MNTKHFLLLLLCVSSAAGPMGARVARAAGDEASPRAGARTGRMGRMGDLSDLKLSDTQREQLRTQRFKAARQALELRAKLQVARLDLAQLMTADRLDAAAARARAAAVAELQGQMVRERVDNRLAVLSILNVDQRRMMRERVRGALRSRIREGRGPGRMGGSRMRMGSLDSWGPGDGGAGPGMSEEGWDGPEDGPPAPGLSDPDDSR